jgi:hypothetical protein
MLRYQMANGRKFKSDVAFASQPVKEMGQPKPFVGNRTNSLALQDGKRGSVPMPSSEYFRRQAEICFRLSVISSGEEVSSQLMAMAHNYKTSADAIKTDSRLPLVTIIAQDASPDLEKSGPQ